MKRRVTFFLQCSLSLEVEVEADSDRDATIEAAELALTEIYDLPREVDIGEALENQTVVYDHDGEEMK